MGNRNDFLNLVATVVCGAMIAPFAWAREESVKELQSPPSGYVMKFERMGGYAGVHNELWIYPDGRVINALGKTAKILPDAVDEWLKKISPAAVAGSMAVFAPQWLCMDCFIYRITIYGKDATKLILWDPLKSDPKTVETDLRRMRDHLLNLSWK